MNCGDENFILLILYIRARRVNQQYIPNPPRKAKSYLVRSQNISIFVVETLYRKINYEYISYQ